MPSSLEALAAFTQDPALASQAAARMEHLRLHIADTLGMMLQGSLLAEGKMAMALGSPLVGWCASARLTEADDIHLTSCTTPALEPSQRRSIWRRLGFLKPGEILSLPCLRATKR